MQPCSVPAGFSHKKVFKLFVLLLRNPDVELAITFILCLQFYYGTFVLIISYLKHFSASGFHGVGFCVCGVCGENPAGTEDVGRETQHRRCNSASSFTPQIKVLSRRGFRTKRPINYRMVVAKPRR